MSDWQQVRQRALDYLRSDDYPDGWITPDEITDQAAPDLVLARDVVRLAVRLEELERERDGLQLALAASRRARRADNEYLIGQRDAARAHSREASEMFVRCNEFLGEIQQKTAFTERRLAAVVAERDEAREALREWDEWARQAPSEVVMQPLRRWWKQRPVFLHALRDPEPLPPADTDRHPPQALDEHDPRL